MEYYCFVLQSNVSVDSAWDTFNQAGFQLLYSSEEPNSEKLIYGYPPIGVSTTNLLQDYRELASFHTVQFDQIDWHDQWGSENSSLFIDLKEYSPNNENGFLMAPGPGFGDLSHPTTRLALKMMAPLVRGKYVIDLGCGSGVLSLAAIKLGAEGVCGIDIDADALKHAKENALLNELENKISFHLPGEVLAIPANVPVLLVMNMIYKEQEQAWNSLPEVHALKMDCITSGVLKQHQKLYLSLCEKRSWQLVDSRIEDKWCGFHFKVIGVELR
ncbi:MAG: 50S ribosomal protein L11 methyltransferase [Parachlamydiaceae bacterium]|nr:50S ribosomal protein L11 methyltransferase [Parachlamydiaceae bacterium]